MALTDQIAAFASRVGADVRALQDAGGGGELGAHAATHAVGGSDPLSPPAIGAVGIDGNYDVRGTKRFTSNLFLLDHGYIARSAPQPDAILRRDTIEALVAGSAPDTPLDNDRVRYGDVISSGQRRVATLASSLSNGWATFSAIVAMHSFTARWLRFCPTTTPTGRGTLRIQLLVGDSLSSLGSAATITDASLLMTPEIKEVELSSPVTIREGQIVAWHSYLSGYTGTASIAMTPTANRTLLNPRQGQRYDMYRNGNLTIPGSGWDSQSAGYTDAQNVPWWALA